MRDDRSYFLNRAEFEVRQAQTAAHEKAAWAHYALAGFYWDRAYNAQDRMEPVQQTGSVAA